MRCLPVAALLLVACARPAPPWPSAPELALDLKCTVSAEEVALLQPVTVVLDRWRAADRAVEFAPQVDAQDFLADPPAVLPEVPFDGGFWQRTELVLRPLRGPGELTLPAFVARTADGAATATTPARTLRVTTTLAAAGAELEAPAAPFPARGGLGAVAAFAGGWALLLLLLWFVTRRRRLRGAAAAIAQPPHITALRALARLRGAPRGSLAEVTAFYVEVSAVLRVYLEQRFGLRAPEQTTEEFLRALELGDALAREHRAELQQFLQQCDLVKFAAHVPAERDHLATFAIAEAFVERTRADRVAAVAPPEPAAPPAQGAA